MSGLQDAGILFPRINDDARSKSHQIGGMFREVCRYGIGVSLG